LKTIVLGVLNLADAEIESVNSVADRIRRALHYVSPDRLVPAPDCGMKYLARDVAFGKLKALAQATKIVRAELA
jgi:5-methyltetrahydropteroyltriglutamate--homocysteine methyltransferase